ncbi:MAG: replicative DNA helicase [Cyanobacteria bacterium HKST-UBA03]|nr:replicative DNA helicase [Cyanobacteria bacterium HKST-UBA03]
MLSSIEDGGFERLPPQSLEAEQAVLGCILIDPDAILKVLEIVRPEDFYRQVHKTIYSAMLALFDRSEPIDIVTVSESLNNQGHLEDIGGRAYINELALAVVTSENVAWYAQTIHDKSILRGLVQGGTDIVHTAYESTDAEEALDKAEQIVFNLAQRGLPDDLSVIRDILPVTYEMIEERYNNKGSLMGVSTGFYELDTMTSGLQRSDLIIVAARPSMGKTAFALNVASHVALKENKPTLVFSLEMSKEQLTQRLLCSEAEVDAQRIRTGEITPKDFGKLSEAMGKLGDAPLFIDDTPAISLMELRAKARKLMMEHGELGMIMIDYLQLMEARDSKKGGSENRAQEISTISRGLKSIAREMKVPLVALSQLSRAVEGRQDKKPMLSDLRESGSIEQDADLVMFLYRDEYYSKELCERPGYADVILAKQRNGPVGSIELLFRNQITKFLNPQAQHIEIF